MSMRMLACLLLWLVSASVQAHTLSVAHVDVSKQGDNGVVVEVDLALRDLALTLPLDLDGDNAITWGELSRQQPALERLLLHGIQLSTAASSCTLRPQRLGTRSYDGIAYASMAFSSDCSAATGLTLRYDLIFDQDPAHRAIVAWRLGGGSVQTEILQADARSARLTATGASGGSGAFMQFLREGVQHILGGIDHLAFLLALLLPAVLVRRGGRWESTPRIGGSLRSVAGVVTAFTLAHSITLSLAALGVVRPDGQIVEVVIAASVLLAALNNIWPVVTGRVWLVALGFGLIHGMGFARALQDLGLPQGQELIALLGFNLGVELGQLGVVALIFPLLAGVRRQPWYARFAMPALSVLIAVAALYWIGQRVAG